MNLETALHCAAAVTTAPALARTVVTQSSGRLSLTIPNNDQSVKVEVGPVAGAVRVFGFRGISDGQQYSGVTGLSVITGVGEDFIQQIIKRRPQLPQTLQTRLLGGANDDDLTLTTHTGIFGTGLPNDLTPLIDCGAGDDKFNAFGLIRTCESRVLGPAEDAPRPLGRGVRNRRRHRRGWLGAHSKGRRRRLSYQRSMTMKKLTTFSALAIAAALFSGAASAEEFQCTTTVGAVSLDNVFVPDGRTCTLNGTRLNGNIVVGTGATLTASAVRVNGNIQAEGHRAIFLNQGTIVGGSVQIKQGGSAAINGVTVNSDVQLESNSRRITVSNSDIGSNLQVFQNTGGVVLRNNDIAQNMQCKQNSPAPTGGGNQAGDKEDQCAAL